MGGAATGYMYPTFLNGPCSYNCSLVLVPDNYKNIFETLIIQTVISANSARCTQWLDDNNTRHIHLQRHVSAETV